MLIECPFCHTRAKLPESKEGAKVRCAECSKVYRAREILSGGRKPASGSNSGPIIAVIVVCVIGLGVLLVMKSSPSEPAPVQAAAPKAKSKPVLEELPDPTGWDSEQVQFAVEIHERAAARNAEALARLIQADQLQLVGDDEDRPAWSELDDGAREARIDLALESLLDTGETGTVAGWSPYDGELVKNWESSATVKLSATPHGGGTAKRVIQWELVRVDDEWRAIRWEEWLSEAEKQRVSRGVEVVTLSDGSVVVEREPEALEHLEDTPQEVRDRIDELLVTMLDLELTTQASKASRELIEIGKPAIPALLTHLFENKLYNEEDSIRANIAVVALREITDKSFGYQPQALVGSALGTTEERRMSSVRQWFAWWHRKGEAFTGLPEMEEE